VFGTEAIDLNLNNSNGTKEECPVDLPLRLDDADTSPTTSQGRPQQFKPPKERRSEATSPEP
jgi:hypothetical protein